LVVDRPQTSQEPDGFRRQRRTIGMIAIAINAMQDGSGTAVTLPAANQASVFLAVIGF